MVRFEDLRIFVSAADHGSFSAARELDLTPAVASAALKRLELTLETRLFVRSTRSLRLTADGERYRSTPARPSQRWTPAATRWRATRPPSAARCRSRCPRTWGATCCCPGWMNSSAAIPASASRCASATGWPICSASRWTSRCATARPPTPARCAALVRIQPPRGVRVAGLSGASRHAAGARRPAPPQLPVLRAGRVAARPLDLRARRRVPDRAGKGDRVSDDGELVRRWALAGCGVAYKSRYDVLEDLRAGRLVQLFGDHLGEPSPLYLLCVHRMLLSPAVKRLRACLQDRFAAFEAG